MSETQQDDQAWDDPNPKEAGSFHPAIHHQTQTELAGEHGYRAHATIGRRNHPQLSCPNPRYPATHRGFYKCNACGEKVTLADTWTTSQAIQAGAEYGHDLGERWAEAIAGGVGQAFWYTVDLAIATGKGLHWVWSRVREWLGNRRVKAPDSGGVAPEMVHALVVMGMVAARYRPVEDRKEAGQ